MFSCVVHSLINIGQDVVAESWEEHVQRKLQWAIPDEGAWGEANNYELFVKVVTTRVMIKIIQPIVCLFVYTCASTKLVYLLANEF